MLFSCCEHLWGKKKKGISGCIVLTCLCGAYGGVGGPSSSDGVFCLHLMCISEEPDLCASGVLGLGAQEASGGWKKSKKEPDLWQEGAW